MSCNHYEQFHSRRDFLAKTGLGLGTAALVQLLGRDAFAANGVSPSPPLCLPALSGGVAPTLKF